ncbi:MAG: apolipoprotein N-acyltransferase, partial [Bacteroidales bacterium]|nr:apolipoprotein N-acyltransferase [Bacteroidales bacterium]
AISSGLLLGTVWNNLLPVAGLFVGFIPLLYLIEKKKVSAGAMLKYAFVSFFIFHLCTVWWIAKSGISGFLSVISINSFLMASAVALAVYTRKIFGKFAGYWALVIYWLSFEYIHYTWDLQWPFMNLGNWLGQLPAIIQWYEYTGVLGGTLWILSVNIFLLDFFLSLRERKRESLFINSVFLIVIIAFPLYFSNLLMSIEKTGKQNGKALIVQPNINPYTEKYNKSLFDKQISKQLQSAKNNLDSSINLLIFPETSFPIYLNRNKLAENPVLNELKNLTFYYPNLQVIAGIYTYTIIGNDTLYYNTAVFINKNQKIIIHDKSKLVPGVERTPFIRFLNIFKDINVDYGGINASLNTTETQNLFTAGKFQIAPLICYESVFGNYAADFVKKGADIIVVITNDAWWGNTPAYRQIMMHSCLRAIETRRQVIRVGNTGISGLINEKGAVIEQIPIEEETVLKVNFSTNKKQSFYVLHGDIIGRLAAFMSVILILATYVRDKKSIVY